MHALKSRNFKEAFLTLCAALKLFAGMLLPQALSDVLEEKSQWTII